MMRLSQNVWKVHDEINKKLLILLKKHMKMHFASQSKKLFFCPLLPDPLSAFRQFITPYFPRKCAWVYELFAMIYELFSDFFPLRNSIIAFSGVFS